jgi:hypothetical protein
MVRLKTTGFRGASFTILALCILGSASAGLRGFVVLDVFTQFEGQYHARPLGRLIKRRRQASGLTLRGTILR